MATTTATTAARIGNAFAALTGPGVACAARPLTEGGELPAEEERLVARAVEARRREFAAGRECARAALRRLGCPPAAIGRGSLGEPLWPAGFGGSIAHGRAFAAAVAFPDAGGRPSWGIDLVDKPDRPVFRSVRDSILAPAELGGLAAAGRLGWEEIAVAFAAKEAAIKIVSPRLGRFVDFLELEVERGGESLVVHGPLGTSVTARHAWVDGVLVCVAAAAPATAQELTRQYPGHTVRKVAGATGTVTNATLALRDQARLRGSQTAFVFEDETGDRRVSFEQLDRRVDAVARGLATAGLELGARVLISMRARPEFLEAVYATMRAGLTALLVEPNIRGNALEALIEHTDYAAAIVDADADGVAAALSSRDLAARIAVEARPGWTAFEDLAVAETGTPWPTELPARHPAVAFTTSGSTGTPKLIVKTHEHFRLMARYIPPAYTAYLPRANEEPGPYLVPTSLYHTSGLNAGVFLGVMRGWTGVILTGFQPSKMLVKLALHGCSTVMCTPTQASACLREQDLIRALDFSALRSFRVAGGPSSGPLLTRLAEAFAGVEIINVYATTECAPCFGQEPGGPRQPLESCGRPLPGVDARIVNAEGSDSDRGELWLRSDLIGEGTLLDEPRADQLVGGEWYRTGDEFRSDANGWLYFAGRQDDMFVCGGENVHPTEVERILCSSPDVSEACVVGIPDEILGATAAAVVVLAPGATAEPTQLAAYMADNAPPHLVPHRIRVVAEVPTLGPGKFDRARVRADLLGESGPAREPSEDGDPLLEPEYAAIAAAWSEVLGVESVDADVEFLAAGGDSIKAVRLITRLGAHELPITVVDLFERGTVRRLTEHAVAQRTGAAS